MIRARWSDDDHYFGPFTYARDHRGYRPLAVILSSGDGDDYPGCRLRFSAFGHTLILALPPVIKPWRRWVDTSHYEWSKDSKGYWDQGSREYGFTCSEGHVSVALGRVTNDSETEQRWGYFLPWRSWRHIRHSLYDLAGEWFADLPQHRGPALGKSWHNRWTVEKAIQEACPTADFTFADFDGQELVATTRIEEREWKLGEGKFKWLSLFRRAKISRSLDLQFSGETGKRKGSWKGGTIGHSIEMLPGELHEAAFRRYCQAHAMTFLTQVDRSPKGGDAVAAPFMTDAVGTEGADAPLTPSNHTIKGRQG